MTVAPWRAVRKTTMATERICGRRWFDSSEPNLPTSDVPATVLDTPESQAPAVGGMDDEDVDPLSDEDLRKAGKRKLDQDDAGDLKKAKEEIEFAVVKGAGGSTALDLGGTGDCGWRCASFTLPMMNAISNGQPCNRSTIQKVASRAESLARASRLKRIITSAMSRRFGSQVGSPIQIPLKCLRVARFQLICPPISMHWIGRRGLLTVWRSREYHPSRKSPFYLA